MLPDRATFRQAIYKLIGYETHEPEVDRFHASDAKTKIASSSARTSKSYAAWKDVLPDILYHGARFQYDKSLETMIVWIVPPNYDLAKEFDYAYEDLIERKDLLGFEYEIIHKMKNPNQGNMKIQIRWGKNDKGQNVDCIIEVRSAANEKQLQSEEVTIAILSEAARLPEIVWSKYLSTRTGRSVWATTPDIEAAWIYKEIERGKEKPSLKIRNFTFTPRANPRYNWPRYWVEHQKAELRTNAANELTLPKNDEICPSRDNGHDCFDPLIDCEAVKDPGFAEQFCGQWTFTRGRVVPLRKETGTRGEPAHVVSYYPIWLPYADIHVSLDYGFTDPTVVGIWAVGPQQVFLLSSIYETGLTAPDVVQKTKALIAKLKLDGRVKRFIGDPKKPEVVELFQRAGLPIWDVDKNAQVDRKAGHLELMNYLSLNPKTGEPYMLIHESNLEIVDEWMTLRYKDRVRDPNTINSFTGARDDGYDMARYFVMSHPPVQQASRAVKLEDTDFAKVRQKILANRNRRVATVPMIGGSSGLARIA